MGQAQGGSTTGVTRYLRVVMVAGVLGGLLIPIYFFLFAEVTPLAWDFRAYHLAAETYLAGGQFVGVRPEVGNGVYVYPPLVVLLFVPYAFVGNWFAPFLFQSALNLALGTVLAWLTVVVVEDRLGRSLSTLDRGLVAAFVLASTYPMIALGQGQVDHAVALALLLGFLWLERGREVESGLAFAFAAVVKVFPVLVGLWLLYRRAWRTIATAFAAGLTAVTASFLLFGVETHVRYVEFLLNERSRVNEFSGALDPDFFGLTLSRPLSTLLPQVDPAFYTPIAAVLFAPIIWLLYARAETFEDRLVAFLGTLIGVLIVSPASNPNHVLFLYFPMVTLAFALAHRRSRRLILTGMLVMSFPIHFTHIQRLMELAGLSAGARSAVMAVVEPVLTVGTVTLYGLVLVVAGCAVYAAQAPRGATSPDRVPSQPD